MPYLNSCQIIFLLDAGKIPANICIVLSEAFDTLSHSILLHKLSYYEVHVKGIAYSLIQSYLTQRQQIVEYNGCKSEEMLITTGIPDLVIAIAHNHPQQQFIHIVKDNMFAQCSDTCDIPNCYIIYVRLKLTFIE